MSALPSTPAPPLIERFAGEHFVLNSISQRRQGQVLTALGQLQNFLGERPIESATDTDLRAWQISLLSSPTTRSPAGLKTSTVGWHLRMVTPFYRWCWENRLIDAEAMMRIQAVRGPRGSTHHVPRPYSREELAEMWAALEVRFPYTTPRIVKRYRNGTSPVSSIRKHAMRLQMEAIIELALVCGLRKNEIFELPIAAMHWDNKYLTVAGKRVDQNPKLRDVPYPDSTRNAIRTWLRFRGYMGATCERAWISVTGHDPIAPLAEKRMNVILHYLGDYQLHRLRHTCATERLRAGMDVEKLQRFLGHASLAQTMGYAQLLRGDIHKSAERIDARFQEAIRPPTQGVMP